MGDEQAVADRRGAAYAGRFPELEDALCERVHELRRGRPLAPLTIVVGSSDVRTRVGDLLVRRLGAVANVSVVTLGRLAADLAAAGHGAPPAAARGPRPRAPACGASCAARDLAYFAPVHDRPHFAQALAATFADLREACVAPESQWARAALGRGAAGPAPAGVAKAADLRELSTPRTAGELGRRGLRDGAQHCSTRRRPSGAQAWAGRPRSSCTASTTSIARRRRWSRRC